MEASAAFTGLRKPSALRMPATHLPTGLSTASLHGGVLQASKQAAAMPNGQTHAAAGGVAKKPMTSNSGLAKPKLLAPSISTPSSTTRLPVPAPVAAPAASKLLGSAIPSASSFKPLPSFSALTATAAAANPAVAPTPTAVSVPSSVVPAAEMPPTSAEDAIAAIGEEEQNVPACFLDDDALPIAASPSPLPLPPTSQVTASPSVVALDATTNAFAIRRRSPSADNDVDDDEEEAARQEEEDGFGHFTIPDVDPSEAEAASDATGVMVERPPMHLPPIRPFVAAAFPFALDTSAATIDRRHAQITAAEARLSTLRSEIDLYASKMARLLELTSDARFMKHRFVRDLLHTLETSEGMANAE